MNKKRMGTVFLALLMCGLVSQASAQAPEPKFNSNADDLAKIRGVLEEFRQDIIRKDGDAITKLLQQGMRMLVKTDTKLAELADAQKELADAQKATDRTLKAFSWRNK